MEIKNYLLRHTKKKLYILVEKNEFGENFNFKNSNAYISEKRIEQKKIFIITPDKKHRADLLDFDLEFIHQISGKNFTLGLVDENGDVVEAYEFDVKTIK